MIGFPIRTGSDIQIMVYDQTQFDSFTKDYSDSRYAAFVSDSTYGYFDLSNPDAIQNCLDGQDAELQYAFGYNEMGRFIQFTDTKNGRSLHLLVYNSPEAPIVGHQYPVVLTVYGNSELESKTVLMECIKTDDNTAWLVDSESNKGLRLAL